jgi:hypothetical protein
MHVCGFYPFETIAPDMPTSILAIDQDVIAEILMAIHTSASWKACEMEALVGLAQQREVCLHDGHASAMFFISLIQSH